MGLGEEDGVSACMLTVRLLLQPSYRATKADEHWLARRLESVFEPVPNWVSLVVELAFLDELEAGDDGLRWEDLRK